MRSVLIAAALASAGCVEVHSTDAPRCVGLGETLAFEVSAVASGASGADEIVACAELPPGWPVVGVDYTADDERGQTITGVALESASDAARIAGVTSRPGVVWRCWTASPAGLSGRAAGLARVRVTANTRGRLVLRFAVGSVGGALPSGPIVERSVTVEALADPLDPWRPSVGDAKGDYASVRWLDDRFVAVGAAGQVASSTVSERWVETSTPGPGLRDIAAGAGQYVAVGDAGRLVQSADLTTWVRGASPLAGDLRAIAFGRMGVGVGRFVAVGDAGAMFSDLGAGPWTRATTSPPGVGGFRDVTFGAGLFVAVTSDGRVAASADGQAFSVVAATAGGAALAAVAHDVAGFVAVGAPGVRLRSADGVSWAEASVADGPSHFGVASTVGARVLVGTAGTVRTATAAGTAVVTRASGTARTLRRVAAGGDRVVAVGDLGARVELAFARAVAASVDFGDRPSGAVPLRRSVRIQNVGPGVLTLGALSVVGTNGAFAIDASPCSSRCVLPGEACVVPAEFMPAGVGVHTATVTVETNEPMQPTLRVLLRGVAGPPAARLTLGPTEVDLGPVAVGSSAVATFVAENDGSLDARLADVVLTPVGNFRVESNGCAGRLLAPSERCTFDVRYAPTLAGPAATRVDLRAVLTGIPTLSARLRAEGRFAPAPTISFSDSVGAPNDRRVDFGATAVGTTTTATVTLTNLGAAPLSIGPVGRRDQLSGEFSLDATACADALEPGGSCVVLVRAHPSEPGERSDSFDVPSNDPSRPSVLVTVSVIGQADAPPVPRVRVEDSTPPLLDRRVEFGALLVNSRATATVTITNDGTAPLVLGPIVAAGDSASFAVTGDGCSDATLAPGGLCTIATSFAPTAAGAVVERLTIMTNDAADSRVRIVLLGEGRSPGTVDPTNRPPTKPVLASPDNGATDIAVQPKLQWEEAEDPDADPVTYEVTVCPRADLTGCESVTVTSRSALLRAGVELSAVLFVLLLGVGSLRRRLRGWVAAAAAAALIAGCTNDGRFFSHQPEGLEAGTTYFWRVVALDGRGGATGSETWRFTTAP